MSLTVLQRETLDRLLFALRDDELTQPQAAELERFVLGDTEAMQHYLRVANLNVGLRWMTEAEDAQCRVQGPELGIRVWGLGFGEPDVGAAVELPPQPVVPSSEPLIPPIIIDTTDPLPALNFSLSSSVGGWLFSYAAATVIVGMAILGAWAYKVSLDSRLATSDNSRGLTAPGEVTPPKPELVGRITGLADCRWADPDAVPVSTAVPLGGRYALRSGLMEITYQTGAKVILQGPCTYEVESACGGFLALGKLTARVEKKGEGGRGKAEGTDDQKSEVRGQTSPFPLPPSPFIVRTPIAVVTDLGTEFGVEVASSGATRSHVFRGKIEVRMVGDDGHVGDAVQLDAGQSAQVAWTAKGAAVIGRGTVPAGMFIRQLSKRVQIKLFNTGVGVKEGEPDRHWQLAARSDEPKFKPRPALVTVTGDDKLPNDPARSQWISAVGDLSPLPDRVLYTFRTTFDLAGTLPKTAFLRGKFLADDLVSAIRLNGHDLKVPGDQGGAPFVYWSAFTAATGFVEGANVLEIEVLNRAPLRGGQKVADPNPMACRVELEGSVLCIPTAASDAALSATRTKDAGKGDEPMNGP